MSHVGHEASLQSDTSPAAAERYAARLRATSPRERLERALRLSEQVRDRVMADVRKQHPGADEKTLALAFVRRVYGDELAAKLAKRWGRE